MWPDIPAASARFIRAIPICQIAAERSLLVSFARALIELIELVHQFISSKLLGMGAHDLLKMAKKSQLRSDQSGHQTTPFLHYKGIAKALFHRDDTVRSGRPPARAGTASREYDADMMPWKCAGPASRKLVVSSVKPSNAASKARSLEALAGALDTTFFKAIAEPVRQQIVLILLQQGCSNIQDVAGYLVQDRSVVSRHLAFLEQAGMVRSSKVQRFTEYELDGPAIIEKLERLLAQLRATAAICCPPADDACCAAPHSATDRRPAAPA